MASSAELELLGLYRATTGVPVSVSFGCERLSSELREIIIEEGSGHGWGITLTWFRREADGSYAVRKFGFDGNYNATDPQTFDTAEKLNVSLEKSRVEASVLAPLLPQVRASLLASFDDPKPASFHSSRSFVAGMTLVDTSGATLSRWSAAYEDGDAQRDYVPAQAAIQTVGSLLAHMTLEPVDLTDVDRAFFARRFEAAVARFKDPSFPLWTRQAYTGMATWAGGPQIVETLFALADDDIEERTRYLAINALANIAKVDLRRDEDSRDRPLAEVEQRYRRACE